MEAITDPTAASGTSTGMQLAAAMMRTQKDMMEQQGQNALKLVESAAAVSPAKVDGLGNNVDVFA